MPRSDCEVPPERLIAYLDGYLPDSVQWSLAAHLPTCSSCRERVAAFREVDEILRSAPPLVDGARVRRAIEARLRAEAERDRRWRPPRAVLAVLAAVLLVAVIVPASSSAGFGFDHFLRFARIEVKSRNSEPTALAVYPTMPATDAATAFRSVEPGALPFDLALVGRTLPKPTQVELQYLNPDGISVWITQFPVGVDEITADPSGPREVVRVGDTDVVVLLDPWPGTAAGFLWERQDIVFALLVVSAPVGGLPIADGIQILEALFAVQDAG